MILKAKPIKGKPLVSAVICAYNEEKHLPKCINSLLNQTYKPLEIIVVDNSSTDNTWKVIESFKDKRVKGIKLTGFQKGPGRAWNAGAEKAKGKILLTLGGDFIFGKNYLKDMTKPILQGKTIGTMHYKEEIANLDIIWSRAFRKVRNVSRGGVDVIFAVIRKDAFYKYGPFDPELGYADDQTINKKHGINSLSVKTPMWSHNPDTFKETWNHDIWIGKSVMDPIKIILGLPLFPFYAIYKTIWHLTKKDFYWKFIFFLPIFYTLRYFGYFVGSIKKLKESRIK